MATCSRASFPPGVPAQPLPAAKSSKVRTWRDLTRLVKNASGFDGCAHALGHWKPGETKPWSTVAIVPSGGSVKVVHPDSGSASGSALSAPG